MLTVSLLVPAIPTTLIAPPAEAILILLPSSRSISAVSKLIDVPDVLNSTVVAFLVISIDSPLCASIFVVPVPKLYKAPWKSIEVVVLLPITVVPRTPASTPLLSPISSAKTIAPAPSVFAALTFSPANSSVAPIFPLKVTDPLPEVMVRTSSVPSASTPPAKLMFPPPLVPELIVVVPLFFRLIPEVLKAMSAPDVAKVAAVPVISIF